MALAPACPSVSVAQLALAWVVRSASESADRSASGLVSASEADSVSAMES
jgi:hypothetical protein